MGNHVVGSMYNAAMAMVPDESVGSMTQDEALGILDRIHGAIKDDYYYSSDAEFDDQTDPWEKLGKVLVRAFFPARYAEWAALLEWPEDGEDTGWWDSVYMPFRIRYNLC